MNKFNEGFMLGASTAAHQVEGNNLNSDYWVMENMEYTHLMVTKLLQQVVEECLFLMIKKK